MGSEGGEHGFRPIEITRRKFIRLAGVAMFAPMAPGSLSAASPPTTTGERELSLQNPNTRESLRTVYWADGAYLPDALSEIDYLLRDYRTDDIISIDANLLDILHLIEKKLQKPCTFQVISGYRSPKTNAMLRRRNRAVAAKSYHTLGKAVDIRVPGFRNAFLHRTAVSLKRGGVGHYPKPGFVHVDVGPVRCW